MLPSVPYSPAFRCQGPNSDEISVLSRDVVNDFTMLTMIDSVVGNVVVEHAENHHDDESYEHFAGAHKLVVRGCVGVR